jgi:hypothetical protein
MAKELTRRFNTANRTITVEIQDDFGNISLHTLPLSGDQCPMCKHLLPGANGVTDVPTAVQGLVDHIDQITADVLPKFEAAGMDVAEIKKKRAARL